MIVLTQTTQFLYRYKALFLVWAIAIFLSCNTSPNKPTDKEEKKSLSSTDKQAQSDKSIVGHWKFEGINGELYMPTNKAKNQLPGINKLMKGSTIEFKKDGTTHHKDNYFRKESNGTYMIEDSIIVIKNDIMTGNMRYQLQNDTLTMVWPADEYLKQVAKMAQGLTTFEKLKSEVQISDLTYTFVREN